ncbi:CHAT domain-containing protein [Streptomyces sp. 3MP-14]|uniref:CHAT domain-containing protein n=1 Tax=Streptomyces mimosae TaxID=2586635 RepID=A0A5N6A7N0_9ACTN|nr:MULTISPECIES: CHAT domain-containing protein [Streptomyces]KAB8163710.1 CHAT domain-containing protein [Streptomyces mimosae]KAB8175153.1 CHAT domain-containing protein [Streptomyces sp. 3MP-14]
MGTGNGGRERGARAALLALVARLERHAAGERAAVLGAAAEAEAAALDAACGLALLDRFPHDRDPEQLLAARAVFDTALNALPTSHPLRPVPEVGRAHVALTVHQIKRWRPALRSALQTADRLLDEPPPAQLPYSLGLQLLEFHQRECDGAAFVRGAALVVHSLGTERPPAPEVRDAIDAALARALLVELAQRGDAARTGHTGERPAGPLARVAAADPDRRLDAPGVRAALLGALRRHHERRGGRDSLAAALALALDRPREGADGAWLAELAALYRADADPQLLAEIAALARERAERRRPGPGSGTGEREAAQLLLGRALVWRDEAVRDPAALAEGAGLLTRLAEGPPDTPVARAALSLAAHARRLQAERLAPEARAAEAAGLGQPDTEHRRLLDEAVRLGEAAVAAHSAPGAERGEARNDLALALLARAESPGNPAGARDAERALALLRAATAEEESGGVPPHRLVNLSFALRRRHAATGEPALLAESLAAAEAALARAGAGTPDHATARAARAAALAAGARPSAAPPPLSPLSPLTPLTPLASAPLAAARSPRLPLADRLGAARQAAELALADGDFETATVAHETAVALLPALVAGRLADPRPGAEEALAEHPWLAARGASCALRLDQPARALRLLERGRGVLAGRALAARRDLARPRADHPALAAELTALAGAPGPDRPGAATAQAALLARVRALPGHAAFLTPPDPDPSALDLPGPVAVINLSQLGGHALLLRDHELTVVPLPRLDAREAVERTVAFLDASAGVSAPARTPDERGAAGRTVRETLGWLWEAVAGPVLEALDPPRTDPPPRLWWCPTGVLSALPLHAAGHGERAVPDLVVSSYTATLAALAHPGRPQHAAPRAPLIVDAANAHDEVAALTELMPEATVLSGPAATRAAVLAALPAHGWAHFACHATVDPIHRAANRLLLADGALTTDDLARHPVDADLAVLAACATGSGSLDIQDEAHHLATACQLAGYRAVIATLWPVTTRQSTEFARLLYPHLRHPTPPALALHHTTATLRTRYPNSPWLWAPYAHLGV